MKYLNLDAEEEEILTSYENDEYVQSKKDLNVYVEAAKETLNRSRQINIRISERDLQKIKARAAEKGLPYQTFIASVLHQYGIS